MDLSVKIGNLNLKNPVMTASGTFGYGEEYAEFVDLNLLGAIVVKGISLMRMEGNPAPRICETPCGMLNGIGLQNVGLKKFVKANYPSSGSMIQRLSSTFSGIVFGNTSGLRKSLMKQVLTGSS